MTIEEINKLIDALISESISTGSIMRIDDKAATLQKIDIAKSSLIKAIKQYGEKNDN